jgi:rod shape-determining protein MreC
MGLSSNQNSKVNYISNATGIILSPFQRFFDYTGGKINEVFSYFDDVNELREENELLKAENDKLKEENKELSYYKVKIEGLMLALNIKDRFEDYEPVGANIIAKDMGNWFNTFTVDRGMNDGISNNDAVVTSQGLVGRVSRSGVMSSNVVALIDEDSTVSARITKTMDLISVKGDMTLKDQGLCRVDLIFPDVDIAVGDTIETSGLGGYYPKGIIIGEVLEVRRKAGELYRYAIIKPAVDFKRLEEVFILKEKNKTEKAGGNDK